MAPRTDRSAAAAWHRRRRPILALDVALASGLVFFLVTWAEATGSRLLVFTSSRSERSLLRRAAAQAETYSMPEPGEKRFLAREALLTAIAPLSRGFKATEDERKAIAAIISGLTELSPCAEPTAQLGGEWTLIYTDAPDIIGIPEGPLAELGRIGQEIDPDAGTIANVIEYRPSPLASGLVGAARDDVLVQRVYTDYEATSPTTVDLKIRGLGFQPQRVLGLQVPEALRFDARGPLSLPFGRFEILYLDEELRIVRTAQGWYSVNRRGRVPQL